MRVNPKPLDMLCCGLLQAALWGYFAFMAVESFQGSQLVDRVLLLLTDPARRPALAAAGPHAPYLETVPFAVTAAFTGLQVGASEEGGGRGGWRARRGAGAEGAGAEGGKHVIYEPLGWGCSGLNVTVRWACVLVCCAVPCVGDTRLAVCTYIPDCRPACLL